MSHAATHGNHMKAEVGCMCGQQGPHPYVGQPVSFFAPDVESTATRCAARHAPAFVVAQVTNLMQTTKALEEGYH
jgi:hypothetical protein